MSVNELLVTCINQWNELYERNEDFKIIFMTNKEEIELKEYYIDSSEYYLKYRNKKVVFWIMEDINTLKIGIE